MEAADHDDGVGFFDVEHAVRKFPEESPADIAEHGRVSLRVPPDRCQGRVECSEELFGQATTSLRVPAIRLADITFGFAPNFDRLLHP